MKVQLLLIFWFFEFTVSAQDNSEVLINKTFSGKVGSICEETSEPNPCAGIEIFLVLAFKKEYVSIQEKHISSCDSIDLITTSKYDWKIATDHQLKTVVLPEEMVNSYIENIEFAYNKGQLLGIQTNNNNTISEITFIQDNGE